MQKPKKIPMRQCLGCREHKAKRELLRVVRSPEGEISLDARGKKAGRGAYLCPDTACLNKARRSRALENSAVARTPIFALTANAFVEDRNEAMQKGMDGFVSKPIDIRALIETMKELFG